MLEASAQLLTQCCEFGLTRMTFAEALGWYGYVLASSEPKLAEPHKPHVYTTWRSFQYQMAIQASELNTGMKAPTPAQVPKLGVGNCGSGGGRPSAKLVAGSHQSRNRFSAGAHKTSRSSVARYNGKKIV